jgi:hypothetical protein
VQAARSDTLGEQRVRVYGTILSTAALFWGFLQAPFLHIHPEDLDHPSAPPLGHLHLHQPSAAPGPLLSAHTDDDDAITVGWNALPVSSPAIPVAWASPEVPLSPPEPISALPPVPDQQGHDPPEASPKQPRAPPA